MHYPKKIANLYAPFYTSIRVAVLENLLWITSCVDVSKCVKCPISTSKVSILMFSEYEAVMFFFSEKIKFDHRGTLKMRLSYTDTSAIASLELS